MLSLLYIQKRINTKHQFIVTLTAVERERVTSLFTKQYIFWGKIILPFLIGKGMKLPG
jgi:hypothetical protein